MKKSILFRLFKIGSIPKELRQILDEEGIIISDEGMAGKLINKNVTGPGKRFINRVEGFLGCLVITRKRIICYSFKKRQINISINDPKIKEISLSQPEQNLLSISYETSTFREGWKGIMEFRFKTEKAGEFLDNFNKIRNQ